MNLPFKKIRHQTMLVVAFASLLPVVLAGFFFFTKTRDELTGNAMEMQKSIAEAVRQGLVSQMNLFGTQLVKFAEEVPIQSMKPTQQVPAIFRFLDQNLLFFSCFVYDAEGAVVSVAYRNRFSGDDKLIGKNIFEAKSKTNIETAKVIRQVLQTGKVVVSQRVVKSHQQAQLLMVAPIRSFADPGRVIGALSCGIQLDGPQLQGMIENYFLGQDSFIVLSDDQGYVMARKGKNLPEGLDRMILSRDPDEKEFDSTWTELSGKQFIVTLGKIPKVGCVIAIGTSQDQVLGFISQILFGMVLLTLICLVIGFFISLFLSQTLVGPIIELMEGIKKVAEGVVSHRIPVSGESELSEACQAFNEMASQLEKNRLLEEIWSRKWNPPS